MSDTTAITTTPPSPAPPAKAPPRTKPAQPEQKDGTREIIETVVFVVVLVLLLKTFLAEAFVIPTGSMATTLLGYHKDVECEKCGFRFQVNASDEVEKNPPRRVVGYICPNCRYHHSYSKHMTEGERHLLAGRWAEAERELDAALRVVPGDEKAQYLRKKAQQKAN